jgi:HprK-related kinase A
VSADGAVTVCNSGLAWRRVTVYRDGRDVYRRFVRHHAVPCVEWALNMSVFHRPSRNLLLHAAVVEKGGCAAVLPGESGAGKSTLCAALIHSGWRLLSDEVAIVRPADGRLIPAPRPVSLKDDAIGLIRQHSPLACLGPVWRDTGKGDLAHVVPPSESVFRMNEPAEPAWVIFPSYQAGSPAHLERLSKAETFMHCADNAFNYSVLGRVGFDTLADVIDRCSCFELVYSDLGDGVAQLDALVPRQRGGEGV